MSLQDKDTKRTWAPNASQFYRRSLLSAADTETCPECKCTRKSEKICLVPETWCACIDGHLRDMTTANCATDMETCTWKHIKKYYSA
ncbi:hypothetical protein V5799_000169 [Amblyomma americanum]|uniref:Uncharacterized protein n=1 Tax=Amblyomma americanum TaxID=6943 RepID=A0AAQ4D3T9_AMBAM